MSLPADDSMLADDSPNEPLLSIRDVSYSYLGRFVALERVSLDIEAGERVALLGPNGGAKSTLLKILAGLVFADSGDYRAFGIDVTEDALEDQQYAEAFRSRLGFVFQNTDAQLSSPTVRDELAFGPLNMGLATDEAAGRVADMLDLLSIEHLADRAPYQLSEGQEKTGGDRVGAGDESECAAVRRADRRARSGDAGVVPRSARRAGRRRQDPDRGDPRPRHHRPPRRPPDHHQRNPPDHPPVTRRNPQKPQKPRTFPVFAHPGAPRDGRFGIGEGGPA